ncbi:MAG: CBS domain-containing protein [Rhodocyclaceae bacterium]|nr:MAG: CBS domain-containing protein [Rhodocyclaceae bacterium]
MMDTQYSFPPGHSEVAVPNGTAALLAKELEAISGITPFDGVRPTELATIFANAEVVFFRHGKIICHPDIAESERSLWVVRSGRVSAMSIRDGLADSGTTEFLGIGALLPMESAFTGTQAAYIYSATEDSFLWQFRADALLRLLSEPSIVHWLGLKLTECNARLRQTVASLQHSRQVADQALALPVSSIGNSDVTCVPAETPLGTVAALMAEKQVGSIIVGTPEAVVGIVTQTDLIKRAMALGLDYLAPIKSVMTPEPVMIDGSATALDAGIEMARRRFRHLLVAEPDGRVTAVVSERDIFKVQQQGVAHFFQPIDAADSVVEIVALSKQHFEFAKRVFRQGMEVSQFTRMISLINDRLTRRLLSIIAGKEHPEMEFCWLAFGSEGREEQGFVTDQDNGIIFVPPPLMNVDTARAKWLEMARKMNDALHRCGFELCKGNIMAGNPEWCLSLDEWKGKFSSWIRTTTPNALLNASIFFDFRRIYGDIDLAERLRDHLLAEIGGNTICLHMLAAIALSVEPPIGKWNRFILAKGDASGTIDLKTHGTRLFVDAARVFALAFGVRAANTEHRLRAVGKRLRRSPSAIEGDIAAFRFVQAVRLRHQLDSGKRGNSSNQLDPYTLNDINQRMLRESLRQAQSLQERLKRDYER